MTGTARAWTVAVTGASGLVGSALVTGLTSAGHRVVRVVRGAGAASVAGQRLARWDPQSGALEPSALAGADRSEEHTSELQSRLHLVCRLLLLKKKKHKYTLCEC